MPVYCITGANRGLGLEFVRQLSSQPDTTILALTRSLSNDLTDVKSLSSPSVPLHVLECDLGSVDSITSFASSVGKTLGDGKKIDVLINNSGVQLDQTSNSLDFDPAVVMETVRINTVGPALLTAQLVKQKALAEDVRVVNVSSGLGSISYTLHSKVGAMYSYSVSKAGLSMVTAHQALDLRSKGGLARAVVIALDPGWVKTRMGGDNAPLTADVSIGGTLKVIKGLKEEDNGTFWQFTGEKREW